EAASLPCLVNVLSLPLFSDRRLNSVFVTYRRRCGQPGVCSFLRSLTWRRLTFCFDERILDVCFSRWPLRSIVRYVCGLVRGSQGSAGYSDHGCSSDSAYKFLRLYRLGDSDSCW